MTTPFLLLWLILQPFFVQGSFAVLGTVRESGGRSVQGVRVSLLDDNYQIIRTLLVDSSGRFQFRGLRQGNYLVRIDSTGTDYEEQTQRVEFQGSGRRRGGGGEEVFPVDFIVRRKKREPAAAQPPGLVFAQPIPDAARAEYERGASKIKDNKSEQGIVFLKKAIEIFPDYYLALELLGTEYVKLGNLSEAVPLLTRAVDINRAAPRSLYALGVAQLKLNQTAEAITSLEKAISLDARNPNSQLMLGIAHGKLGKLAEAEESLKKAYQLGGGQVTEVHLYLAGIYDKQKKYEEAIRELELFLKEDKEADPSKVKAMIDRLKAKAKAERQG